MSGLAVRVENLGKQYRIGLREGYKTLRDSLSNALFGVCGLRDTSRDTDGEYIWALKGVSFDVKWGEVLGIIGPNGAGKTTLLRVLSRITDPTEGSVEVRGRVGSLLEVGTGFHPELTGRENIYLNGAILGMKRVEIERKFDEVVAFADIERFIDTPVKRYSSGMYIRLAFAVAAHLEPDILIVDEVLAVGDAAFQRKCLGKMGEVAGAGRTVLLVSHNMGAIRQLCSRTLWLDKGSVMKDGDTASVVESYLAGIDTTDATGEAVFPQDPRKDSQLRAARLVNDHGQRTQRSSCDDPITFELVYQVRRRIRDLYGVFQVSKRDGTPVLVSYSHDVVPNPMEELPVGVHVLRVTIPRRTLAPGEYRVHFSAGRDRTGGSVVDDGGIIASFSLDDLTTLHGNNRIGYFSTVLDWRVESVRSKQLTWAHVGE
jgi:lipopolysaccharide transport system ATP-binding protein